MKNLIIFLLLLIPATCIGQGTWNTRQDFNQGLRVVGTVTVDNIYVSAGDTIVSIAGHDFLLSDIRLKLYIADTSGMLTPYALLSEVILPADTAAMLTPYSLLSEAILPEDTAAMLVPYINRSDTAAMLTTYIDRTDTIAMLAPYIDRNDTAAMLLPYALLSEAPALHSATHELAGSDQISHDNILDYEADEHVDHTAVLIVTPNTSGLTGGGDLTESRTITLDLSRLYTVATLENTDIFGVYTDDQGQRKITYAELLAELLADIDFEAAMEAVIPGITLIQSVEVNDDFLRFNTADRYFDVYPPVSYDTTNWYFAVTGGSDNNHGHSPDFPKQTFTELLTLDLDPGDSVFFQCGDTWREVNGDMTFRGAEDNHITFTSYGDGARPRILGSEIATGWTSHGSNRWKSNNEFSGVFNPSGNDDVIYFVSADTSAWGIFATDWADIDAENKFYYSNDTLYVYSTSDPSTAYVSIEVPEVWNIIDLQTGSDSAEFLTFDNLEIAFGASNGIYCEAPGGITGQTRALRGLEVRNCKIHHIGHKGSGEGISNLMSDVIIENNIIYSTGRHGFGTFAGTTINTDTLQNILIQDNYFTDGWHTTGPDIINENTSNTIIRSIIIRRNIIEEPIDAPFSGGDNVPSMGIFVAMQGSGTAAVEDISIYNNLFRYPKNAGAIQIELVDSLYVYNNTIYGMNESGTASQINITGASAEAEFYNNIIYNQITGSRCLSMTVTTGYDFDYNLWMREPPLSTVWAVPASYNLGQWSNYKAATGWDANSPTPADPLFKDPPDSLMVFSNSDAVDGGVDIDGYTTDYEGNAVGSPPNIGAYERTEPYSDPYSGWIYDPTNRYIDATNGNDAWTGTHPDTAWQTIAKVNSYVWTAGDSCFFDGGEIYRGQISNPEDGSAGNHVVFTISPYGSSVKPVITTAINENSTGDWVAQGGNIYWNSDAAFTVDVGNLIFPDGSIGKKESSSGAVNSQGDFWYDYTNNRVVMYSVSNPYIFYGEIECAINTPIVAGGSSDYITYDNLSFKWGGRHGISYNGTTNDITITECDFIMIGGCENYEGFGDLLGNGIEFYTADYDNIIIERNYFEDIFDASITPQYATTAVDLNNWYINGNVFYNVRSALELAWGPVGEIHTFHFNNNTCYRDENYAFVPAFRWSAGQMAFVTFYDAQNAANTDVDIYNNIFYYENISGIYSAGVRLNFYPWPAHIDVDYNLYYSPDAFSGDHCLGNYSGTEYYTLGTWQSGAGQDPNGYNSNPDFYNILTNWRVGSGSDAVDGGVAVGEYSEDFEGEAVGSPPNIGAVETTQD